MAVAAAALIDVAGPPPPPALLLPPPSPPLPTITPACPSPLLLSLAFSAPDRAGSAFVPLTDLEKWTRMTRELDYFNAYIRLREPGKSKDKADEERDTDARQQIVGPWIDSVIIPQRWSGCLDSAPSTIKLAMRKPYAVVLLASYRCPASQSRE
ncbi:hypothetical protein B296_00043520 [Ensete ventricosum]|uniref:Uncharacterized protein n=1 Tax=Ensete ventricosum TaxID=4639 RepID=A0A426XJN3_ENSVE|nr:hypothetical protein B296_00043520 [Ensete ventricosum]